MHAPFLLALLWTLVAPAVDAAPKLGPEPPGPLPRVRVNTLWVVPELGVSWVEPLIVISKPGGNLYQIDGNLTEYTIANSLRDAVDFLRSAPDKCPGFIEGYRKHDLFFMWEDVDQPRGGPSAGLAFAIGGYAAMVDLPVLGDVAFTGAVDNTGRVKAVAGLALKVKACRQATMRTLCLPAADGVDPATLDIGLCEEIRLVGIERVEDAFFEAFGLAGPRKAEYDRMLNAWNDYRQAKAERRWSAARLALDNIIEIQPGDLSARRLVSSYARVDMREAAANLFADAATFERDGQRGDALRVVRRAWGYADETLRGKYRAVYDRLERAALGADDVGQLTKAEQAMADGDVVTGWRLLSGLCARLPRNSYLAGYQARWQVYAEVAATASAAEARPDDAALQAQLAQAYLDRKVPAAAARVYGKLRAMQPDTPKWPLAEAYAWHVADRSEKVAEVLRSMRPKFAVEAALAQTDYNVELRPPELQAPALRIDGNLAWSLIRSADGSGPPRVGAQLDDGPVLAAPGTGGRVEVDLGRLTAGAHRLHLTAVDRFGNETRTELPVAVPQLDAASALRILDPPAALPAGRLTLDPQLARQRVPLGARLSLDGGALFPGQSVTKVALGEATATAPPYRL
ncbi:MAG: hypothetical protein HZB16_22340, partial [Armatimonadetes bacterium]|nr:hypothetical protein [Armatimonadota bacterium]